MEDKIIEILKTCLPKRNMGVDITYESDIKNDILIDSINVVGFLNKIEDAFDVSILDDIDSLVNVHTVRELSSYLLNLKC